MRRTWPAHVCLPAMTCSVPLQGGPGGVGRVNKFIIKTQHVPYITADNKPLSIKAGGPVWGVEEGCGVG